MLVLSSLRENSGFLGGFLEAAQGALDRLARLNANLQTTTPFRTAISHGKIIPPEAERTARAYHTPPPQVKRYFPRTCKYRTTRPGSARLKARKEAPCMVSRQIDATGELQRSLDLLVKNWMLAIPTAVAALLTTAVLFFFVLGSLAAVAGGAALAGAGHDSTGGAVGAAAIGSLFLTLLIALPLLILVSIVAYAAVVAESESVWKGNPPDLTSALQKATAKLPALIIAGLLIFCIILVSFIIPILGTLAAGFFLLYVIPAIMIGNDSGTSAIGTSFRLVRDNIGPSAIAFIAILVVSIIGQIIDSIVGHILFVNFIVAFVVGGFTAAYCALVSARFYDLLTPGSMVPAGMPPPPPPGSSIASQ